MEIVVPWCSKMEAEAEILCFFWERNCKTCLSRKTWCLKLMKFFIPVSKRLCADTWNPLLISIPGVSCLIVYPIGILNHSPSPENGTSWHLNTTPDVRWLDGDSGDAYATLQQLGCWDVVFIQELRGHGERHGTAKSSWNPLPKAHRRHQGVWGMFLGSKYGLRRWPWMSRVMREPPTIRWWLNQPIWNKGVKFESFPQVKGEQQKNTSETTTYRHQQRVLPDWQTFLSHTRLGQDHRGNCNNRRNIHEIVQLHDGCLL